MQVHTFRRTFVASAVITIIGIFGLHAHAQAATFNMPDQSSCDNGSTTLTWVGEGVVRPQISSMTVDGTAIADPANPELNSLGAVVCPNTTKGNRTSVSVIWHTDQGNTSDLSIATTPTGDPVTTDTKIAITMTNLGDNAANFTFTLVYGSVSSWTTANLGTTAASVDATISPVRTPHGSGDDFGGCTAVPPDCHANKSGEDVLGASFVLSFEPGVGINMAGSYFALTGAMGGWVTSSTAADGSKRLVASLGAPHFLADGTTLNTGSMEAFIPTAVLNSLFGLASGDVDTSTLDVTRTSDTTTTSDVPFTIHAVTGGITLSVSTITFSSPKYTIKMTAAGLKLQQANLKTISKYKTTYKIIGKSIKANGTGVYTVQIRTRNKFGTIIKVQPILISSPLITIGKPTFKSNIWTFKLSARRAGTKTITVTSKGRLLKTLKLIFVKA